LPEALIEVRTPWGALTADSASVALAVAVFAGWYLSLEQVERTRRRELSLAYAAAWLAAASELVVLKSLGAPAWIWPVAAATAAVVGVALVSPRGVLAERLDLLAPALGLTCVLMLVQRPVVPTLVTSTLALIASVFLARNRRAPVQGRGFLAMWLALLPLTWA